MGGKPAHWKREPGRMIKGGTDEEILGLNEESLWSGYYKDKNNPGAAAQLEEVRRLIFAGKNKEAERLIQKSMLGEFNESYLPWAASASGFPMKGRLRQRITAESWILIMHVPGSL